MPFISDGSIKIKDISTNYIDTISLKGVEVRYQRPLREEILVKFQNIEFSIGKQTTGDRLLAVNSATLQKGSFQIFVTSKGILERQKDPYAFFIQEFHNIQELLLTRKIKLKIIDADFLLVLKSKDGRLTYRLDLAEINLLGDFYSSENEFCPSIRSASAKYKKEKIFLDISGCIHKDFMAFSSSAIQPEGKPQQLIKGNIRVFQDKEKGEIGVVKLFANQFDLKRILSEKPLPLLNNVTFQYTFDDSGSDTYLINANIFARPFWLQLHYFPKYRDNIFLMIPDSKEWRWQLHGADRDVLNTVLQVLGFERSVPNFIQPLSFFAKGSHVSSKKSESGTLYVHSELLYDTMFPSGLLKGSFRYSENEFQIKEISFSSGPISFLIHGWKRADLGWDLKFSAGTGGLKKLLFQNKQSALFFDLNSQFSVLGNFLNPDISGKLELKNISFIQYKKQDEEGDPNSKILISNENAKFGLQDAIRKRKQMVDQRSRNAYFFSPREWLQKLFSGDTTDLAELLNPKQKIKAAYYYHFFSGSFAGNLSPGGIRFQGKAKGYETEKKRSENEAFDFDFSWNQNSGHFRFSNFTYEDLRADVLWRASHSSPWKFSMDEIRIIKNSEELISSGKAEFWLANSSIRYNLWIENAKSFRIQTEGVVDQNTYDIAIQSSFWDYHFWRQFNLDFSPLRGKMEMDILASNDRANPYLLVSLSGNNLTWEEKGKGREDLGSLVFSLKYHNSQLAFLMKNLQKEGDLSISIRTDFGYDPLPNLFSLGSNSEVLVEFVSSNYKLDLTNYFFKGWGLTQFFSKGILTGNLLVKGKASRLETSGDILLKADQWILPFNTLRDVSFAIVSDKKNRGQIQLKTELSTLRGLFNLTGLIMMSNLMEPSFKLNIAAQQTRLYIGKNDFFTIDIENTLEYKNDLFILNGNLRIYDGKIYFDELAYLRNQSESDQKTAPPYQKILRRLFSSWYLDLNFEITDNFWVKSGFGEVEIRGKGEFQHFLDKNFLQASIDMYRGTLYMQNNNFAVESGRLTVFGFDPQKYFIQMEAKTQIAGGLSQQEALFYSHASEQSNFSLQGEQFYDIYLNISGELAKPSVEFRSNPPLSKDRILTGLVLGKIITQNTGGLDLATTGTAAAINLFTNQLNSYVEKRIGLDTFKFQVKDNTTESVNTAAANLNFTVGQYLTRRFYIQFQQQVKNAEERPYLVTMEYNLTNWLKLIGSIGKEEKTGRDKQNALVLFNFKY